MGTDSLVFWDVFLAICFTSLGIAMSVHWMKKNKSNALPRPAFRWLPYGYAIGVVSISTVLAWTLFPRMDIANLIMIYLLGILALASRQGTGPCLLASFLSVLAFDFFFVPPRFTFEVADAQYLFMFSVMLLVALSISHLTERVKYHVEKNQSAQIQIETERHRSSLLSSVSHDLRTPLAAITGSISSLLENGKTLNPETQKDLLENVYAEAERLERLVNNLLEMTKLESGSIRPNLEPDYPGEVIGSALARMDEKIKGRSLTTQIAPDLPLVPMDSLLVEQILVNLLDNALKYTPPGSPLEISALSSKGFLEITVGDRGPGLPKEDLPKIFDKFYRGPQTNTPSGAGLGLSICKGMARVHGGDITAENRTGGGALFRVTLPLKSVENRVLPKPDLKGH